MGQQTGIEWCDATFNPWRGCEKVSEGCKHCYAETQSKRNPRVLGEWGKNARRSVASESYWNLPGNLNTVSHIDGRRRRVFCGSLMDVWEARSDLVSLRARLLDTIAVTPYVDWLLLSKRPQNWLRCLEIASGECKTEAGRLMSAAWIASYRQANGVHFNPEDPIQPAIPENVWAGWTVENDARCIERCEAGLKIPAAEHFVSAEPLLDMPDLRPYLGRNAVSWVIVGGESGGKARPFNPDWARVILDACHDMGAAFYMKQMGDAPTSGPAIHLKGDPWNGIPPDLRVREFPREARFAVAESPFTPPTWAGSKS